MKTQNKTKNLCIQSIYSLASIIKSKIIEYILKWKMEKNRRELLRLGDHLLRDIGLNRKCLEKGGRKKLKC